MNSGQTQARTGTRDETYDIISVLYHALQGVENCQTFCDDAADDQELKSFFEDALNQQKQLAERAKQLLQSRMGQSGQGQSGAQGGSAFSFRPNQSSSQSEQNTGSAASADQSGFAEQGSSGRTL